MVKVKKVLLTTCALFLTGTIVAQAGELTMGTKEAVCYTSSCDVTFIGACHPSEKKVTIVHVRAAHRKGFESATELQIGDIFTLYDEDWVPYNVKVKGIDMTSSSCYLTYE